MDVVAYRIKDIVGEEPSFVAALYEFDTVKRRKDYEGEPYVIYAYTQEELLDFVLLYVNSEVKQQLKQNSFNNG